MHSSAKVPNIWHKNGYVVTLLDFCHNLRRTNGENSIWVPTTNLSSAGENVEKSRDGHLARGSAEWGVHVWGLSVLPVCMVGSMGEPCVLRLPSQARPVGAGLAFWLQSWTCPLGKSEPLKVPALGIIIQDVCI